MVPFSAISSILAKRRRGDSAQERRAVIIRGVDRKGTTSRMLAATRAGSAKARILPRASRGSHSFAFDTLITVSETSFQSSHLRME